jgi:ribosomal protein L21
MQYAVIRTGGKQYKVKEEVKIEEKVEELKEAVEVEPTVEDVFKKTKRKK